MNAKIRRLRWEIFGALADFPGGLERVRNAVVKRAYQCPTEFVKDSFCEQIEVSDIRGLLKSESLLRQVESYLRRFHCDCAFAFDGMPQRDKVRFLARLDTSLLAPFFVKGHTPTEGELLALAGEKDREFRERVDSAVRSQLPRPLQPALAGGSAAASDAPPAKKARSSSCPEPVLIRYDSEGQRTNAQVVLRESSDDFVAREWVGTLASADLSDVALRAALFYLVSKLPSQLPALAGGDLRVEVARTRTRVFANRRFAEGELMLAPLVRDLRSVQHGPTHPHAVPLGSFSSKGELHIVPSVSA